MSVPAVIKFILHWEFVFHLTNEIEVFTVLATGVEGGIFVNYGETGPLFSIGKGKVL